MKISLIVAVSENKVIGRDNQLPWSIPEDLKRFKRLTTGHPIVMGRKTYDSIGRPLPGRTNIVITRDPAKVTATGIDVVSSLDEALAKAAVSPGAEEVFVIGGGQIFQQAIVKADKLYLTIIHKMVQGDTFLPDYSSFTKETFRQDGASEDYTYTFVDLEK
jgi:dihydrofolate reductase